MFVKQILLFCFIVSFPPSHSQFIPRKVCPEMEGQCSDARSI
jgi:hypothetical protein